MNEIVLVRHGADGATAEVNATDRETTAGMRRCQRLPDERTPVIRRARQATYQDACRSRLCRGQARIRSGFTADHAHLEP